jgi:hypothetical protein
LMETGQAKPAKHGVPVEAPSVTPPQAANVAVPHAH